jgi:hypothetical protein
VSSLTLMVATETIMVETMAAEDTETVMVQQRQPAGDTE